MSLGKVTSSPKTKVVKAPLADEPESVHEYPDSFNRVCVARHVIELAMGGDACVESHVRLARRFTLDQLKDLEFLLRSFED